VNMTKRQISQEYLCDFSTSGETFLDSNTITWMGEHVKDPIAREGFDRNVWIWKHPLSEHDYILSADVSRGDAKDYSTFHIIDTAENEVVAEYKGKVKPDNFAEMINEFGLLYNKALVCPENNSYGYATILKLQDLQYPKIYYRKKKQVYVGNYVPQSSVDIAGFNTNGKTRSTILSKLEEVLRNRQLITYSSRFYEETKVFTWNGGRAQARKGFNDDLVMSLAIGSWLFDASSDYSKNNKGLNDAMLDGMGKKVTKFNHTSDQVYSDYREFSNSKNVNNKNNVKQDINKTKNQSGVPTDFFWLIR